MRRLGFVGLIAGLALAVWLIAQVGVPAVATALRVVGWTGLLTLAGFHLAATTLMGLAWWRLQRAGKRRIFVWGRLVRDAGSELLPLSQLGGSVLGARVLIINRVAAAAATASTVVDATLEFGAQISFIALGILLLMQLVPNSALVASAATGLAVAITAAIALISAQIWKPDFLPRLALRFTGRWLGAALAGTSAVEAAMRKIYRSKRGVWTSFVLHLAAWLLSGAEGWLALRLLGVSVNLAVVLALESMVCAMRAMAFAVPNAIGVQEGAYVLVGATFGLTPEIALSVSLLRRGRDLVLGVPALASWQLSEILRHRSMRSPAACTDSARCARREHAQAFPVASEGVAPP